MINKDIDYNINYYNLLCIKNTSDKSEIKKSYYSLSFKLHPDKGGDPIAFAEISKAYNILSDKEKKSDYDKKSKFGSSYDEYYEFMEFDVHRSVEETRDYLNKLIKRSSAETGHYWFIRLKPENKIAGTFGLLDLDRRKGSVEIGYGLSPVYWGKGLYQESLKLVLKHLFLEKNFHRVWAKTQADNVSSIKALERSGFKREGTLRDFYLSMKDGKYHDAAILGILKSEFVQ